MSHFSLYVLFVLAFVQLFIATALIMTPLREFRVLGRWSGSRPIEVLLSAVATAAFLALAGVLAHVLWNLPVDGLEVAACILFAFTLVVIVLRPDTNFIGQVFYAAFASSGLSFIAYAALIASAAAHTFTEGLTAALFLILDVAALLIWNSNVNYATDVMCRTRHSLPQPAADPTYLPMVSLHIAAYNEPPDILIETIKAAERIEYPDFEIVIIDNNTKDPDVWRPVEEYCRGRERVRFVHVDPWPGFKSGACNLALRTHTDARAEIVGIIDADDIVQPHYLREVVPHFCDPRLGFVQTFEGNREYQGSKYCTACVDSFQSFYLAIMSSRNERNSVPFVGTMGLFRRSALVGVGGWNDWCISEDTEASLRALKAGWSGLYVPRCFGRGVVPPTYAGLKTQRYRWCFGAMQIFRLHWRSLLPWDRSPDNHLTSSQRRDYLMGCLGWLEDLMMLVFAVLLLVTTGLIVAGSGFVLSPLIGAFTLLPMTLILIATVCMVWTQRQWTTISRRRAVRSLMVSLSATLPTALACVQGMTKKAGVFRRTSKSGSTHRPVRTALRLSRWETLLAVALYASAVTLALLAHPPWLLVAIIAIQASVFACAPTVALWNVRAERVPRTEYQRRFEVRRARTARNATSVRVLGTIAAVVFALGLGVAVASIAAPDSVQGGVPTHPRHHDASQPVQVGATGGGRATTLEGSLTAGTAP
jgi:cellulose synthase/poly-beta-1,6-N-acetylglucosamine synthase-like glycosyltransferase